MSQRLGDAWARVLGPGGHLASIPRKLSLSSRAAAAAWGVRTGLLI